jgi:hypothetical protein
MAEVKSTAAERPSSMAAAAPLQHPVWARWARLKRLFATWRFVTDAVTTRSGWSLFGLDFVTGMRRDRSTERVMAIMQDADAAEFDAVTALAALNARRQDRVFKAVAVAYLSVPVTLLATWGEVTPDAVERVFREEPRAVLSIVFALTASVLIYFMSSWQSRRLVDALDLARIERDARPFTALELRDE